MEFRTILLNQNFQSVTVRIDSSTDVLWVFLNMPSVLKFCNVIFHMEVFYSYVTVQMKNVLIIRMLQSPTVEFSIEKFSR